MQHLKPIDIESRLSFARWVTETEDIVGQIWFSDEAHFYLNAQVNKKNATFLGTEKQEFHIENVTVWAALSAGGIIALFIFRG